MMKKICLSTIWLRNQTRPPFLRADLISIKIMPFCFASIKKFNMLYVASTGFVMFDQELSVSFASFD